MFPGKRGSVELSVRGIACLAAGLGIRGTARGFAGAPHPGLHGRVEATEQLPAFAPYGLGDGHVSQGHGDELSAGRRAGKDGARSQAEAITRLERSPHWVGTAMEPASPWRLTLAVGNRPLALAPPGVPQGGQGLAPDCVPLGRTEGFKESMTAVLPH
jgi:hypothetical protein